MQRIRTTLFRFLSRYREGRHDDGALRRCSALEKRMQMEKRFRTSHVDPITVATRGRVSPAISGNSNFKSRFRDYRAGNESVKEKRYEEMEGERERERERRTKIHGWKVVGGKARICDSCWSFRGILLSVIEKSSFWISICPQSCWHSTPCDFNRGSGLSDGREGSFWSLYQSRPSVISRCSNESKEEQFRSWTKMDIVGFSSKE